MQITILGTAAAEGWPAVFCGCATCNRARQVGGHNRRSRASVQLGQEHKIDLPPDSWYHEAILGADLSKLKHLFITHSHPDHLSLDQLDYLDAPFAHNRPLPIAIYGNKDVVGILHRVLGDAMKPKANVVEIEPFVPIEADGLTFIPTLASHKRDETCLNYIVSSNGKSMLYASDTGYFPEDTWRFLESVHLDCVICECTDGPNPGGQYHMDFTHLFAVKKRLQDMQVFEHGVFVATHFSHNVGLLHDELENILREHGILTAYDGMIIKL